MWNENRSMFQLLRIFLKWFFFLLSVYLYVMTISIFNMSIKINVFHSKKKTINSVRTSHWESQFVVGFIEIFVSLSYIGLTLVDLMCNNACVCVCCCCYVDCLYECIYSCCQRQSKRELVYKIGLFGQFKWVLCANQLFNRNKTPSLSMVVYRYPNVR